MIGEVAMIGIGHFGENVKKNKYMIVSMVKRELKQQYNGSLLGIIWSILNPIAIIITYYFVFSLVLKVRLGGSYGDKNFTVWLVGGLLPWMFFSEAIIKSTSSVSANNNLITKTQFPSELLPLISVLTAMVNHFITLGIFLIIMVVTGAISIKVTYITIVFYTSIILALSLGLGWILSALNVYLRDISQIIAIVLNLLMYFTPIIYSIDSVPAKYLKFLKLNPMYHITEGYRKIIFSKFDIGDVKHFIILILLSIFTLIVGKKIFERLKDGFADVL